MLGVARDAGDRVAVVEVDARLQRRERDRAVHRAGVEGVEAERVGHARATVDLPEPAGPSMATTRTLTTARRAR